MNIIETRYKIIAIGNPNENKTGHVRDIFEVDGTPGEQIIYVNVYMKDYHTTAGDMRVSIWDMAEHGSEHQGDPTSYYSGVDLILVVNNGDGLAEEIASIQEACPNSTLYDTEIGDDLKVISLLRALADNHELELL